MNINLKVGNTFLVSDIEGLDFNKIEEGNQFLIIKEYENDKYEFLKQPINLYIMGMVKSIQYNGIFAIDKNDMDVDLSYESDYDEEDNEIEGSEKIVDVYNESKNDELYYLYMNNNKYLLPDNACFDNKIETSQLNPFLKEIYKDFFKTNLNISKYKQYCNKENDRVFKSYAVKINDNLAIVFTIEIKYDIKKTKLEKDFDVFFITSNNKYSHLNVNGYKLDIF